MNENVAYLLDLSFLDVSPLWNNKDRREADTK